MVTPPNWHDYSHQVHSVCALMPRKVVRTVAPERAGGQPGAAPAPRAVPAARAERNGIRRALHDTGRNSRVYFTVQEAGTYYVATGGFGRPTTSIATKRSAIWATGFPALSTLLAAAMSRPASTALPWTTGGRRPTGRYCCCGRSTAGPVSIMKACAIRSISGSPAAAKEGVSVYFPCGKKSSPFFGIGSQSDRADGTTTCSSTPAARQ